MRIGNTIKYTLIASTLFSLFAYGVIAILDSLNNVFHFRTGNKALTELSDHVSIFGTFMLIITPVFLWTAKNKIIMSEKTMNIYSFSKLKNKIPIESIISVSETYESPSSYRVNMKESNHINLPAMSRKQYKKLETEIIRLLDNKPPI